MIQKILCSMLLIVSLASCGSSSIGQRAKRIELGMTKKEVTAIMGNSYDVLAGRATPDGNLETIRYTSVIDYPYVFHFLDNKLVEWFQDVPPPNSHPNRGNTNYNN